jgi:hypothetical protein
MAKAGYFVSRCKGRLCLPAENSWPQPLPGQPGCGPIALSKAKARVLSDGTCILQTRRMRAGIDTYSRSIRRNHEAGNILCGELSPDAGLEGTMAKRDEIFIAVPECWRDDESFDTGGISPASQYIPCAVPGRIVVMDDIEPAQNVREQDGREVCSRKRGDHRHAGQDLPQ